MALLVDSGSRRLVLRTYLLLTLLNIVHVAQAQQCFVGGWSLRYPGSCPQDAKRECGSAADLQLRCCPDSLECVGDASFEGNYCCPNGTDCQKPSYDHPKCPDESWTLWGQNDTVGDRLDKGGWCCKDGFKGVYRAVATTANYFCTATTVSSLEPSFYWASTINTTPCLTSATSTGISATTSSGVATPTGEGGGDGDGDSGGMSGGAIAGAAIGGVAGVALIGAGVFFLVRRSRRPRVDVATAVIHG
ncbi:hypothetical protein CPLU01_05744 [Colletotrichum plurivorum]|uniref:Uncharacterized protein n=1 Tax=Colletotrichum plurivorum TaxID=2175906 RepID=A0A8H6KKM0_9PEZI|nr:hypothetical protein CPLU01_05744 [Colletotrichum plurivorum]